MRRPRARPGGDAAIGLLLTAGLTLLAFTTSGGFDQTGTISAGNTWAEIAVTLLGTGAVAAMLVLAGPGRPWGAGSVGLFAALTGFTALSIIWSVQPDDSWQAANLTLAYLAVFAAGAALARLAPGRWPALVGALATLSVILSGYALLGKVFPAALASSSPQGRLQIPFGYWNATGLMAALGLAPCLWAWTCHPGRPEPGARTRRTDPFGARILRVLAVPAVAILISVVVLSYSRSAVLVAIVGLAGWLAVAPRRLWAAALLALGGAGALVISGWALSSSALTSDGVSLARRSAAGHSFGLVVALTLVALAAAGFGLVRAGERVAVPGAVRRRVAIALLTLVALLPLVGIAALAASSRGLTGQISHAWSSLTSVSSGVGDSAARLGQFGSSRPLYWREGIKVGEHAVLKGVGALGYATARTRYTTDPHVAGHAHSYVVQTFADLGLIGLAISLALLLAWGWSAGRAVAGRTGWTRLSDAAAEERRGLLALVGVVLAFGLQSAIDWTWFFPGVAVPVLLAAGWLAGRGPLSGPVGRAARPVGQAADPVGPAPRRGSILTRPVAGATVTALTALALLGAWIIWQPLRSADAVSASLRDSSQGQIAAAFAQARTAAGADPLALEPKFLLAALYSAVRDPAAARAELRGAVALQPQNPLSWQQLGAFDLAAHQPERALAELRRALTLDPIVVSAQNAEREALAELVSAKPAAQPRAPKSAVDPVRGPGRRRSGAAHTGQ